MCKCKVSFRIFDFNLAIFVQTCHWPCLEHQMDDLFRPGGEGGNGLPKGKFMKLDGKINFGVLSLKIDVIRAENGAISLVLTNKASFSC